MATPAVVSSEFKGRAGIFLWITVGAFFFGALCAGYRLISLHPHGLVLFIGVSLAVAVVGALVRAILTPTVENRRYSILFSLCMVLFACWPLMR
jgi:hypothetical protein